MAGHAIIHFVKPHIAFFEFICAAETQRGELYFYKTDYNIIQL